MSIYLIQLLLKKSLIVKCLCESIDKELDNARLLAYLCSSVIAIENFIKNKNKNLNNKISQSIEKYKKLERVN